MSSATIPTTTAASAEAVDWQTAAFALTIALGLIGSALGMAVLVRRWFGLVTLRRQAHLTESLELGQRTVWIGFHSALQTPICFGWRRPLILLPEVARDWSELDYR